MHKMVSDVSGYRRITCTTALGGTATVEPDVTISLHDVSVHAVRADNVLGAIKDTTVVLCCALVV